MDPGAVPRFRKHDLKKLFPERKVYFLMYKIYYEGEDGRRYYIDLNMKDAFDDKQKGGTWKRIQSALNVMEHVEATHRFPAPLRIEDLDMEPVADKRTSPAVADSGKTKSGRRTVIPKQEWMDGRKHPKRENQEHAGQPESPKRPKTPKEKSPRSVDVTVAGKRTNREEHIHEMISSTWQERNADERFQYVSETPGRRDPAPETKDPDLFQGDLFETVKAMQCLMASKQELIRRYERAIYYEDGYELDILHKLEMQDPGAGTPDHDYVRMLRESRLRRREAKDRLDVLKYLDQDPPDMESAVRFISRRDDRRYNPRVLKELFAEEPSRTEAAPRRIPDHPETAPSRSPGRDGTPEKASRTDGTKNRRQTQRSRTQGGVQVPVDRKRTPAPAVKTKEKSAAKEATPSAGRPSGKTERKNSRTGDGRKSTIRLLKNLMEGGKKQGGTADRHS